MNTVEIMLADGMSTMTTRNKRETNAPKTRQAIVTGTTTLFKKKNMLKILKVVEPRKVAVDNKMKMNMTDHEYNRSEHGGSGQRNGH